MTRVRVFLSRLAAMVTGRSRDDDLLDDIEAHLSLLADEYRRQGLSDEEATRAARRAFGGIEAVREAYRDTARLPTLDSAVQDLRLAFRRLLRDRAYASTAIGLLAVGIGSTVVMADILDRLLVRPPAHVTAPERVARLYLQPGQGQPRAMITNYATVERLSNALGDEVEAIAAYAEERLSLDRGVAARQLRTVAFSPAYFDVLGLSPRLGVLPSARSTTSPDAAIISHALWQQHFGGDPGIVGRPLRLGTRVYTIVAVTPAGFAGIDTDPVEAWLPLATRADDGLLHDGWRTSRAYLMLRAIARLRADAERTSAEQQASAVLTADPAAQSVGLMPDTRVLFGELSAARAPGGTTEARIARWVATVTFSVLLIACGNVGNLLFVRGLKRSRELAMKAALGATRARLFREVLAEAVLLSLFAGVSALLFVSAAGAVVRAWFLPPVAAVAAPIDWRLVVVTAAISIAAAFALGMLPALRLTRERNLAPGRALALDRPSLLLDAYVGLQVALSVPLIVGAGLFAASLWHARQVNFGIDLTGVVVVSTNLDEIGAAADNHEVHRRIADRLATLPQVESAAVVQVVPMIRAYARPISIPGRETRGVEGPYVNAVDPSYFDVVGARIVEGRPFTDIENTAGASPVAVINETMASTFWPGESAIGKCLYIGPEGTFCTEVIGVVENAAMWPRLVARAAPPPMYFHPIEAIDASARDRAVLVRVADSSNVLELLRAETMAVAPDLPFVDVWRLDDVLQPALRPLRLGSGVFVAFAALALIIASVGLAAVTAHNVTRRRQELGIRLALGARPAQLARLVLRRSLVAVLAGAAGGVVLAAGVEHALRALLFGVDGGEPGILGGAVVLLMVVSALAAIVPARRAAWIDPAETLRAE